MSNSKKYDHTIAAGEKDLEEMKDRLSKLRYISDDERTEAAMLRSRIDEQSSLIMMLKKRSDDNLIRVQALERSNEELMAAKEVAEEMLQEECNKSEMLDRRFFELAENHEEMIAIKDSYKRDNEKLRQENARLAQAVSSRSAKEAAIAEVQIRELQDQIRHVNKKYGLLEDKLSVSEALRTEQEQEHALALAQLKSSLAASTKRCAELEANALVNTEALSSTTEALKASNKEKEEYIALSMQRGKLIQERQVELKNLQHKLDDAEQRMTNMQVKFAKEAESVNVNHQVKSLRQELENKVRECKELEDSYDAYKLHTSQLLASEKELNARLRKLFN